MSVRCTLFCTLGIPSHSDQRRAFLHEETPSDQSNYCAKYFCTMRRDNGTGPARPLGRESDATLNFGLLGNPRYGQDHALAIGTTTCLLK